MPRGSKPGERRGGRQRGTPNKKTALINAAFAATASNPDMSPLDFLKELKLATFNARAETVAEKPFFRGAFKRNA
jgi:putative SOS response-associated peptidase YedK